MRPGQDAMLDRLRLRADLGDDLWYVPESPSERTTLAFLAMRGKVERDRVGARMVYRLPAATPELTLRTGAGNSHPEPRP